MTRTAGGLSGRTVRRNVAAGALIFGVGLGIGALAGARPDSGPTGGEGGTDAGTPRVTPSAPHADTPYSGVETATPPFFFVGPDGSVGRASTGVAPHGTAASPSHRDAGGWAI